MWTFSPTRARSQEIVAGVNAVYLRRLYEAETCTPPRRSAPWHRTPFRQRKNVDERIAGAGT